MKSLENYSPFDCLDKECLDMLKQILVIKHYSPKEIIFFEEDRLDALYFLLEGSVKLYKVDRFENEIFLGILDSGLLLDFQSNTFNAFANAECLQDCYVACFEGKKLIELVAQNTHLLRLFFAASQRKIALYEEVILKNLIFDSTAKVAYSLFYELKAFNMRKKQDNALLLNIQPETLSRILKKLHNEEIIAADNEGKIKILNAQKLRNIFKQDI